MKNKKSLSVFVSVLLALTFVSCTQKVDQPQQPPQKSSIQDPNVAELIGQLDNNNPDQVAKTIEKIASLGPKAEAAIPALLRKLGDRDFSVNYNAKKALIAMGEKAAKAVIQSNDKSVIGESAFLLKDFGPLVVPLVMDEVQKTRNSEKFMSLLLAISDMGEPAKAALPTIKRMKANAKDNLELEALLTAIETQIEQGRDGLDKLQQDSKKGLEASRKELDNIYQEFREDLDKAITFNFSLNPPQARTLMMEWNNSLDKGLPELEKMLVSEDMEKKALACAILSKFCERDEKNIEKALPKIKQLCSDPNKLIRLISSVMANKLGDKTDYSKQYIESLKDFDDPMELMCALGGLIQTKTCVTNEDSLVVLETVLEAKNKELSMSAAIVLLNSGVIKNVQEYAERLLLEPNSESRANGSALIAKIGPAAQSSISKMRRACELETNEDAKSFIRMAINSLGEAKDDLLGLVEQAKHTERIIRLSAFGKMEKMSSQKKRESIPYLLRFIKDGDEDTQALALSTLCSYGADAEPAFNALTKLLEYSLAKQDGTMQFLIAGTLGEIGKAESAPLLLEVIKDGEGEAANSALISLRKLGPKAKAIVSDLLKLAKDPKHRGEAFHVLDSIRILETDEQKKSLAEFLGEKGGTVSFSAMEILAAQSPEVSIPFFQEAVLSTNDDLNLSGFLGLYTVGKKNPAAAIEALEQAKLRAEDPKVKARIDRSIQELRVKKD